MALITLNDLSFDEAFSFLVAKKNVSELLTATAADNHPPLYFLALKFWLMIFGNSEVALRSLSLLFAVSSIGVLYFLAKKLFNKNIAIISSLLLAVSPSFIHFALEARMYSMFTFLTLLTVYLWVKKSKLFIFTFILALYTHYYAFLLFIPFLILSLKLKLKLITIPFLSTIPWLIFYSKFTHPGSFIQPTHIAIPATFASFIVDPVSLLTLFRLPGYLFLKLLVIITSLLLTFLAIKGLNKLILVFLLSPIIILAIINLFVPVYSVRPMIYLSPFFYILVARGLKNRSILATFFLFFLILINILANPIFRTPPTKEALKFVNQKLPIYHTSILTYYPSLYYQKEANHILVTQNPLSPQTIEVIGGKTQNLDLDQKEVTLLTVKWGTDPTELNNILVNIRNIYPQESINETGTIKIHHFEK